jgi:hypothetical protein
MEHRVCESVGQDRQCQPEILGNCKRFVLGSIGEFVDVAYSEAVFALFLLRTISKRKGECRGVKR